MNPEKDVLVFLESVGEDYQKNNEGILSEGRRIAECLKGSSHALAIDAPAELEAVSAAFGACSLHVLKGEGLSEYRCEAYSWSIGEFLKKASPRLFLLAHSDRGKELAPRVACHLKTVSVTDCVDIRVDDGSLTFVKALYGDQFEQEVSYLSAALEIATFRSELLDKQRVSERKTLNISETSIEFPPEMLRTRHLGLIAPSLRTVDIVHAKRVVGAGLGTVDDELQVVVQLLADLLQGALGTTRPVVDEGRLPKERMIGQTGKEVSPDLYLALGVSGSPHHMAGIRGSRRIMSINRDPHAPIHQFSDLGFVGDLKGIVPKLVNRIREWKEGSSNEGL